MNREVDCRATNFLVLFVFVINSVFRKTCCFHFQFF